MLAVIPPCQADAEKTLRSLCRPIEPINKGSAILSVFNRLITGSALPVVDESGRWIGLITAQDVLRSSIALYALFISHPCHIPNLISFVQKFFAAQPPCIVEQALSDQQPPPINESATIPQALFCFAKYRCAAMGIISSEGLYRGLVYANDILRTVANMPSHVSAPAEVACAALSGARQ